jgi:hypothetical protein
MAPEPAATHTHHSPLEGTQGSGDLELELAITKMRGSIMRTITELDSFCVSVREARARIEQLAETLEHEHTK